VDASRGNPETLRVLQLAEQIYLPFVVLAELRAGFLAGSRAAANEQALVRFLNSPRVQPLLPDEQTTHHYAQLFAFLRRQGTPIPTNDLWIAALTMQHELALHARDRHFDHLPQLPRI
jgi:tRNA(fMet)-specific endonuclease VapC